MKVVWSASARRDRNSIFAYIAERNASAAVRVDQRLFAAAASLAHASERGRPGLAPDTRELSAVPPYIIIYEIDRHRQIVRILRVWHTARLRDTAW